jgi:hypothetical protein
MVNANFFSCWAQTSSENSEKDDYDCRRRMSPVFKKTIWADEKVDGDKNKLVLRSSKTVKTDGSSEKAPQSRCEIEISSPAEDDCGRPIKKKKQIEVTQAVVNDINAAVKAIQDDPTRFNPGTATVQLRVEAVKDLWVIYEVLPHTRNEKPVERYVIADGEEKVRFIVGSPEEMGEFRFKLETALKYSSV